MDRIITLKPGHSLTVKLPSGRELVIQATPDFVDVVTDDDRILYQESVQDGSWYAAVLELVQLHTERVA